MREKKNSETAARVEHTRYNIWALSPRVKQRKCYNRTRRNVELSGSRACSLCKQKEREKMREVENVD